MSRINRAVLPLRLVLVALFAVVLLFQVLVVVGLQPGEDGPGQFTYLLWIVIPLAVLGLLCVQVVIVCTWALLTMVVRDRIFSEDALRWVDAIVWTIVAGLVVLAAAFVPAFIIADADDAPGVAAIPLLMGLVGSAVLLLMIVMRALLRQATTLRSDMEAVI